MYEDAWFNPFTPSTQPRQESSHRRRISLLKQPHEEDHADAGVSEDVPTIPEVTTGIPSPPPATVARRAKSYTDFYHVVRAQIKRDADARRSANKRAKQKERRLSQSRPQVVRHFEDWYEDTSEGLLDSSHEKYSLYQEQLQSSRSHLDSLLEDTDSNLKLLSELSESFRAVDAQSSALQTRCESLLAEQRKVSSLADDVTRNLQYYNYLDPITRRLNAPGVRHFVRGDDFSQMLAQLDDCLEYMQAHSRQREASTYASRYRLLLTRGLTLIRVHFTNTLRETAADVSKRIADRQLNDTTMPALLYAKFRVPATDLKQLGLEIQRRAVPPPGSEPGAQGEYQSLVNELHQSYSAARGRLIIPLSRKKMAEIALAPSTAKDLVAFARTSISYIRGVCLDEYELWHEWFDGDDGLYEFLEAVCEPLYDYLRPRTIHETQLPKLCEMCSLLQVRYMEEHDDESETEATNRLDFSTLIRGALEDAQTRLVFLTLAVLRADIERYKPTAADLNYPARARNVPLSGTKSKAPALSGSKDPVEEPTTPAPKTPVVVDEEGADSLDLKWRYESQVSFRGWFPTLQKAIWLLSKIYRLVNSSVFDDLAHQIVHQTTLSLVQASAQISTRATAADGQMFLLKQLLILKQQIVAFDIEFVTPDMTVDFSSVTSTFWELRERGGLFNPGNIFRLVGSGLMPKVVENMLDAKAELDARLRTVIGEFTNGFAARMTASVSQSVSSKSDFDTGKAMRSLRAEMEKEVALLRGKLDEYLDEPRTKETLAGAVQDQALANYEDFFERHLSSGRVNGSSVSKKGKGRQDDLWDPDTFADWATTIFGVGTLDVEDDDDGSGSYGMSQTGSN